MAEHWNFRQKLNFWPKIKIFAKDRNVCLKIEIISKNWNFRKKWKFFDKKWKFFDENWNFKQRLKFSTIIEIFDKKMKFSTNFLTKMAILNKNGNFWQKLKFLTKIEIFAKNRNFRQKYKFSPKIQIFAKNQTFRRKSKFWSIIQILTSKKATASDCEIDEILAQCSNWNFPIFELRDATNEVLSKLAYRLFDLSGLFSHFRLPRDKFLSYFRYPGIFKNFRKKNFAQFSRFFVCAIFTEFFAQFCPIFCAIFTEFFA